MDLRLVPGVYTSLVAPFDQDGELRLSVLSEMIEFQFSSGAAGLLINGSMGEFTALSQSERERITEQCARAAGARGPLVVGVSAYEASLVTRLARSAVKQGAAALMVAPLGYWKLERNEILDLFASVSEAAPDTPIVAYNTPVKAGATDLTPDLLADLAQRTNVRYVKESSGQVMRIQAIAAACGSTVRVFAGGDADPLPSFSLGAFGWMSGVSNILAAESVQLHRAVQSNDFPQARALQERVGGLALALASTFQHPIASTRAALEIMGFAVGSPRPPLRALSDERMTLLRAILSKHGVGVPTLTAD